MEVRETSTNGTSSLIGKYCMGNAYPWGEIKSRGNNMTVIFRSDYWKGEPGFKARYRAIQVSGRVSEVEREHLCALPSTLRVRSIKHASGRL